MAQAKCEGRMMVEVEGRGGDRGGDFVERGVSEEDEIRDRKQTKDGSVPDTLNIFTFFYMICLFYELDSSKHLKGTDLSRRLSAQHVLYHAFMHFSISGQPRVKIRWKILEINDEM